MMSQDERILKIDRNSLYHTLLFKVELILILCIIIFTNEKHEFGENSHNMS